MTFNETAAAVVAILALTLVVWALKITVFRGDDDDMDIRSPYDERNDS